MRIDFLNLEQIRSYLLWSKSRGVHTPHFQAPTPTPEAEIENQDSPQKSAILSNSIQIFGNKEAHLAIIFQQQHATQPMTPEEKALLVRMLHAIKQAPQAVVYIALPQTTHEERTHLLRNCSLPKTKAALILGSELSVSFLEKSWEKISAHHWQQCSYLPQVPVMPTWSLQEILTDQRKKLEAWKSIQQIPAIM